MKSLTLDTELDVRRKLLWCLFWANRKAIRTEGCAPFRIEKIATGEALYHSEQGKLLRLSGEVLEKVEKDMNGGKPVDFTITIGAETFDITFYRNVFSVTTRRNKEMEAEIIESLHEELIRGKPNFCASFLKRIGIDMTL
ncbi:MAG: hypothetical protein JW878_08970 [Methanomicrobia archaeon]|nr:hypothetical protein [Methanomicrobia archaeon]